MSALLLGTWLTEVHKQNRKNLPEVNKQNQKSFLQLVIILLRLFRFAYPFSLFCIFNQHATLALKRRISENAFRIKLFTRQTFSILKLASHTCAAQIPLKALIHCYQFLVSFQKLWTSLVSYLEFQSSQIIWKFIAGESLPQKYFASKCESGSCVLRFNHKIRFNSFLVKKTWMSFSPI